MKLKHILIEKYLLLILFRCSTSLPIENALVKHVVDCCYVFENYPVPGFVFELQTDTVQLAEVKTQNEIKF